MSIVALTEIQGEIFPLIEAGKTKLEIADEYRMSGREVWAMFRQHAIIKKMETDKEFFAQVDSLITSGLSDMAIKQELAITIEEAKFLRVVHGACGGDDGHDKRVERNRHRAQAEILIQDGKGLTEISEQINPTNPAGLLSEIRSKVGKLTPESRADAVERITYSGGSEFEAARVLNLHPKNIRKISRTARGGLSIADESFKNRVKKGIKLSVLQRDLGVTDANEARKLFRENFPDAVIIEKASSGDVLFLPMASTKHFMHDRPKVERNFKTAVNEENNYMAVEFDDSSPEHIKIYNLTDVHVGSTHFREELFVHFVNMIAEDPCSFVVLGGDLFEFNHRQSVGDPQDQTLKPNDQVFRTYQLLEPVKDKIIAYRSGNHDADRGRFINVDIAEMLAHYLEVPYFTVEVTIDVVHKGVTKTIILDHGKAKSSTPAAIIADTTKFKNYTFYPVHARFSGHVHRCIIDEEEFFVLDHGKGKRVERFYNIVGGSFTARTGSYAEKMRLPPSAQDLTYFWMKGDEYGADRIRINCA